MKEVATILYGSQNYRLDNADSDKDYKILMMPEFEDFYNYHRVDKNDLPKIYDPEHYNVMSVLKFDENIRKGNINALEMLFSLSCNILDENLEYYFKLARRAYAEGYIFSVWDTFIATVEGMIKNSLDRYGVNRKSASRAFYLICLCHYIAKHDFEVDYSTWGTEEVYVRPRELRYDETIELPTKETIYHMVDIIKTLTDNYRNYHKLMNSVSELNGVAAWDGYLARQMKDTVKFSLNKEL